MTVVVAAAKQPRLALERRLVSCLEVCWVLQCSEPLSFGSGGDVSRDGTTFLTIRMTRVQEELAQDAAGEQSAPRL